MGESGTALLERPGYATHVVGVVPRTEIAGQPPLPASIPSVAELEALYAAPAASTITERQEQLFDEVWQQVAGQTELRRSVEDGEDDSWVAREAYSHSIRLIRIVGQLAVEGKLDTPEGRVAKESLRDRFRCSVVEMLHTDRDTREKLEIVYERKHLVRNGHIMALDGKTDMAGMCRRGVFKAELEASKDPRMQTMAERCAADARVAQRVEKLPVGSVLMGISAYPKEDMAKYGKEFYENHGFREGLSFIQWYYRLNEGTLLAATYSVDHHDLEQLRKVWNGFGGDIPAGEVTNTWLDHDVIRPCTLDQARTLGSAVRDTFYERVGAQRERYSVDEFMDLNQAVADELFESLYMSMVVASATRQTDAVLETFVDNILRGRQHLSTEVEGQLTDMRRRATLQDADIALLEQLVRYAVTERMRGGLALVGTTERPLVAALVAPSGMSQAQYLAMATAAGVIDGAMHNRTYGGCTVSINLARNKDGNPNFNPQDVFGGLGVNEGETEDEMNWTDGVCQVDNCPTRPDETLVGPCDVCWHCQEKFNAGMNLEQIVEEYARQMKIVEAISELAGEVLHPAFMPLLGSLMLEYAKEKSAKKTAPSPADHPARGVAQVIAIGRVKQADVGRKA